MFASLLDEIRTLFVRYARRTLVPPAVQSAISALANQAIPPELTHMMVRTPKGIAFRGPGADPGSRAVRVIPYETAARIGNTTSRTVPSAGLPQDDLVNDAFGAENATGGLPTDNQNDLANDVFGAGNATVQGFGQILEAVDDIFGIQNANNIMGHAHHAGRAMVLGEDEGPQFIDAEIVGYVAFAVLGATAALAAHLDDMRNQDQGPTNGPDAPDAPGHEDDGDAWRVVDEAQAVIRQLTTSSPAVNRDPVAMSYSALVRLRNALANLNALKDSKGQL
jgi:hypothetical protein